MVRAETNLPEHFRVIVERSLAKDPKNRYDSTRDLAGISKESATAFGRANNGSRLIPE